MNNTEMPPQITAPGPMQAPAEALHVVAPGPAMEAPADALYIQSQPADIEATSRLANMKDAVGNIAEAVKGAGADTKERAAEFWNQHGATVTQIGKGALTGAGIELRKQIQNQEPDNKKIMKAVFKSGAKGAGTVVAANKSATKAAGKDAVRVGGAFAQSYRGRRAEQRQPQPVEDTDSDEFAVAA